MSITVDPSRAPDLVRAFLDEVRPLVDERIGTELDRLFLADAGESVAAHARLREAMGYAVLGPGKRLRPALTVAACRAVGGDITAALPAAAALEMLHAYTLVHDDLPAMDDDDMRRGRPSVHKAFGEATAILVGDALLTAAFGTLAALGPAASDAVAVLARRAGAAQLIAGQVMDLELEARGDDLGFEELEAVHWRKTGALFAAATELGAIAGGANEPARRALATFGMDIGIAFQYADDRDDEEHTRHAERARQRMRTLTDEALDIARDLGERGATLVAIATWMGGVA